MFTREEDKSAVRAALESSETCATVIHAILREQYGDAVYDWEPQTVILEVRDDFGASMHPNAVDRWSALQVGLTSDAFFTRPDAFQALSNSLADGEPAFEVFDPVTTEEAAWAIMEMSLNRDMLPFAYPVRRWIEMLLAADGYAEGDYPLPMEYALSPKPDLAARMRTELSAPTANLENADEFVRGEMQDMRYQFDQIPLFKNLDNVLVLRPDTTIVDAVHQT